MRNGARLVALFIGLVASTVYGSDEIQSWHLKDGTEVLLLEDNRAPLVSIQISFDVNRLMPWSIENSSQAAFVCQMKDTNRQIEREIERSGVFLSTYMGWARAGISGSSLETDFPTLLRIIRKVLSNRDCGKNELRKWQRDRVISWRSTTTSPRTVLNQEAIKLLYPDADDPRHTLFDRPQPISRSAEKLTEIRDAVLATPARNIAVSGSIGRKELHDLIQDLLPDVSEASRFKDTTMQPHAFINPAPVVKELKDLTQVYMALIRDSLPINHEEYPVYDVVNQILGGTFNSRLYQKLRHETGDTYSATLNISFTTPKRAGLLMLQTYTRVDNALETEQRLKSVLEELHANGVSKAEVERALAYLKGSLVFSKQTPSQIVNRVATNRLANLPSNFWEATIERASQMSLNEINSFVQSYYDPAKFALVKVVPESD